MNKTYWEVIDTKTGAACQRAYETFGKANRKAERLNQQYGAVRYAVVLKREA